MTTARRRAHRGADALRVNEGKRAFFEFPPDYDDMTEDEQRDVCLAIARGLQATLGVKPTE